MQNQNMNRRIILKGFYGFGNFGDDILMLTTYKIIKETFPQAEIFISSESKNPNYIHKYLPGIKIVNASENLKVDWIIHGGGGVFFDFSSHGTQYRLLNQFIKLLGYNNYRKLYESYQTLKGKTFAKQKARAGLGIGVGTYTSSSNRFFSDILSLSSFDILLVRDDASVVNAKQYTHSKNIYKASDLAFLFNHWMPSAIRVPEKRESIGFILRDWIFNDHVAVLMQVAKQLLDTGYEVKFFALDETSDAKYIKSAAALGPVFPWRPDEIAIEDYLSALMTCKLVISSRAHGAIVSACLGIPVLCVCIEPKLAQVAAMLSNSARVVKEPFNKDEILKYIDRTLQEIPLLKEAIAQDVARNNQEMSAGISVFRNFVLTKGIPQ